MRGCGACFAPGTLEGGTMSKPAGIRRAAAAATVIAILTLTACSAGTSRQAAARGPVKACAQLTALAPSLMPLLDSLQTGRISLVTNQSARQIMLRVTGVAAKWAASTGTPEFTTLFRHLRHLWNWPHTTIPELAAWVRHDFWVARTQCNRRFAPSSQHTGK